MIITQAEIDAAAPLNGWLDTLAAAASSAVKVAGQAAGIVADGAKQACGVVNSPIVQAASSFLSTRGGAASSIATGAQKATELCTIVGPTTSAQQKAKYPPGSYGKFHVGRKVWRIYAPSGFGLGDFGWIGDKVLDEVPALPAGVPSTGTEGEWYKNKWLYIGLGSAAAVGTGAYFVFRKKR